VVKKCVHEEVSWCLVHYGLGQIGWYTDEELINAGNIVPESLRDENPVLAEIR
jgi:hypothetical protein